MGFLRNVSKDFRCALFRVLKSWRFEMRRDNQRGWSLLDVAREGEEGRASSWAAPGCSGRYGDFIGA